jgi:predicted esterase
MNGIQGKISHIQRSSMILIGLIGWLALVATARELGATDPPSHSLLQLANAYRETERSIALFPTQTEDETVVCNRAMDGVAIHFFSRDYGRAIKAMHGVILDRIRGPKTSASDRWALALGRSPDASYLVKGEGQWPPKLELIPQYEVDDTFAKNSKLVLCVRCRGSSQCLETELTVCVTKDKQVNCEVSAEAWRQFWNAPDLPPGTFDLEIKSEDGVVGRSIPWEVLEEPLSSSFDRLMRRYLGLDKNLSTENARSHLESRLALLDAKTSQSEITRWALGAQSLISAIDLELSGLEHGSDPYQETAGDMWMSVHVEGAPIACRIYRPTRLAKGMSHPVVIALHGAGGNEHMFMETLGAGRIKALADRHGFIVVSPSTLAIMSKQSGFVEFLDQINKLHPIQRDRVSLIGHSMGAFTATQLGSLFPEQIRSMALIAGGPRWGLVKKSFPRTRVYLAENDAIVPSKPIAKSVANCQRQGIPIDSVEIPDVGHVLVVAAVLDDAVAWVCN